VLVEQPDRVVAAVTDFIGGRRVNPHYRRQEAGTCRTLKKPSGEIR
jgi:hypothetical protein